MRTIQTGRPLPQVAYISGMVVGMDRWQVRPLTVTGLLKGIAVNFISLNYWRFMVALRVLGFLTTPEGTYLSWRHFTFRFWAHAFYRDRGRFEILGWKMRLSYLGQVLRRGKLFP